MPCTFTVHDINLLKLFKGTVSRDEFAVVYVLDCSMGLVKCRSLFYNFSEDPLILYQNENIPCGSVSQLFFANWLAALYFLGRFLDAMWRAAGRIILLVNKAQVCCVDTIANPPANRKQALVISQNIKSIQ